jgi:Ran GTPase-activating protein (RanGAP) involved in mRNA processing and transport
VTVLHLNSNSIGDEGARALAGALPRMALKEIWLDCNSIGDEGARALASALSSARALEKLGLIKNSIGEEAKMELRHAEAERSPKIDVRL